MPELPEIEVLRRELVATIEGKTTAGIHFFRPDLREAIPTDTLTEIAAGSQISAITRRSKYLIFNLDLNSDGQDRQVKAAILIHLGMSGRLELHDHLPSPDSLRPHTHWFLWGHKGKSHAIKRNSQWWLSYSDPRRFGRLGCYTGDTCDLHQHPYLKYLGREPLDGTCEELAEHLSSAARTTRRNIKTLIMDTRCLVGTGNIYANESLFRAGIHPLRRGNALTKKEILDLSSAIRAVLTAAIESGGSTIQNFHSLYGTRGPLSSYRPQGL